MASIQLFGWTLGKKDSEKEENKQLAALVAPVTDDGAVEVAPGGAYGLYVDLEGKAKNEAELITKYREMSMHPECDSAIQDIVNESIVIDEEGQVIDIVLDRTELSESVKKKIKTEFETVLKILDFNNMAYDIFRKWYIDGRLFYQIIIDSSNEKKGIIDIRYIDPRRIRKIRESIRERDPRTGAIIHKGMNEYYLYNQTGIVGAQSNQGIKIAKDTICYVHSGILDSRNTMVLSNLHKAIKPLNQLRMVEDAVVIYRLARAPERRIFYIDVGNLPKMKAEQYLRDMMVKHKNKLTYDVTTGEVRDDRKFMTMLEDFWLPRREGGKGTEVSSLPGGANLGEMEDVNYFRKNLYRALNVPPSRMESETGFNLGRSSEITRDELKFNKFVNRLRSRFSILFDELLEIQLSLKGIVSRSEWKTLKQDIYYDFMEDNNFTELKETELLRERLQLLGDVDQFVGKYFSGQWVRKKVLRLTDEEIDEIKKEIEDEEDSGEFDAGDDEDGEGAPPMTPPPQAAPEPQAPPPPSAASDEPEEDQKKKKTEKYRLDEYK